MRITFASSYLSIHSFPEVQLPDFSVLTGLNGAGKTHFLQALQAGYLRTDAAPNHRPNQNQTEIRLFDWNSLVPQETGIFMSEQLKNERVDAFNQYNNLKTNHSQVENLRNLIRQHGLPEQYIRDPVSAALLTFDDLSGIIGEEAAANSYDNLRQTITQVETFILNNLAEPARLRARAVTAALGKPLLALNQEDFFSATVPSWGEVNIFQQSFARLFVAYRDAYLANQMGQYLASKGETNVKFVSDEDFVKTNGPAPWKFVNDSLAAAGLDFRINHPLLNDYTPFQPQLTKRSTGDTIPFGGLSSGEKVLMSFAFCVYYSSDRRQLALHPKVILLDEVDAPLHPSMSRNLIQTIETTLVRAYDIKVILTTHSPSTVAMAPEHSVYVMRPGVPGLHKTSRAEALNLLTVGVPTLAISYDGRRQVFVESPNDAKIYDGVYKILKPRLASERSLEFVATGTRSPTGAERNTGCDLVKKIVSDLTAAGNQTVFGLIDWDGHHQRTARIAVLAEGARNGLENALLDPAAIALLICRDFPGEKHRIGIDARTNFIEFAQLTPSAIQDAVSRVTEAALGGPPASTTIVEYVGGLSVQVDTRYLTMDDHQLEQQLLTSFPFLRSISRQHAGKLALRIVSTVFTDVPDIIPLHLQTVLIDLLKRESH